VRSLIVSAFAILFCVLFGVVDLVALVWFYKPSNLNITVTQLALVTSEFFCVIYAGHLKRRKWFIRGASVVFAVGFLASLNSLYIGTLNVYGVDWFVVFVRSVLAYVFAYLYVESMRIKRDM